MSNALTTTKQTLPALKMDEAELMAVLGNSLYPGAAPESIKMAIGYCKAAGLDPMQKPVHIVPMWDSKMGRNRDVIMPGIGLYRVQAARNGCAGVSEPEFGPDVTEAIGSVQITYPNWCRVTVKRRLASGELVEFAAKEFWKENYAVKGGKERSIAPNAMWQKRPYGQIAKCAEAQALRKAFPEIGSEPTADEMEGKALHEDAIVQHMGQVEVVQPEPPTWPADAFAARLPKWQVAINNGAAPDEILTFARTKGQLTGAQEAAIRALRPQEATHQAPSFDDVARRLQAANNDDELNVAADLINNITDPAAQAELNAIYETRMGELA